MQNHKKTKLLIGIAVAAIIFLGFNSYQLKSTDSISGNEIPNVSSSELNKTEQMTADEIKADFDYFMTLIKKDYPYLDINQRLNGIDFLDNEENYWMMVRNVKTKAEFAVKLESIMSYLNNGHSNLFSLDDNNETRNMFYRIYSDILQRGGSLRTTYQPWVETLERKESLALYGPLPSLGDSDEQTGNTSTVNKEEVSLNNVKTKVIENGKVIYIKIDGFNYFNEQVDQPIIHDIIKNNLSAKALVIDIRENGGGSTEYYEQLIVEPLLKKSLTVTQYTLMRTGFNNKRYVDAISKANPGEVRPVSELDPKKFPNAKPEVFSKFDTFTRDTKTYSPKNSFGYKGNVYVLVSSRVFSASESFASFCKNTGFATLIGEQTGGDGIGIDPALFCLPNSGILGRYPLQYGMMSNGEANEEVKTQPDYIIENVKVNENLEQDKCIQKVIELENL